MLKRACLFCVGILMVGGLLLPGCVSQRSYTICVLQWGEARAYCDTYQGLVDGLVGKGYEDGKNLKLEHVVAKGDYDVAKRTIEKWRAERPSIIVTLGTKATLAAKEVLDPPHSSIPLVFAACAFPNITGIISDYVAQRGITGVGAEVPTRERIGLLLQAFPNIRVVGIPYFPLNPQAIITAKRAQKLLEARGIRVNILVLSEEEDLHSLHSLSEKIERLAKESELVYLPTDPVLYVPETLNRIIDVTMKERVPLMGSTLASAKMGTLLAVYSDFYENGRETSTLVDLILNGEPFSNVPPHPPQSWHVAVNLNTARQLDIILPRNVLLRAKDIIGVVELKQTAKDATQ